MGPTASGKTDLAIKLAKRFPIAIISVDSALIYKGMDIGTAKPDKKTLIEYPHALVDICKVEDSYSAAQFSIDAKSEIKKAFAQAKLPVLVGGTSFYFRTLEYGLSQLPDSQPEIRARLEQTQQEQGVQFLHQQLADIDPLSAKRLNSNDKQRIMRALEVYQISGKPLSELQAQKKQGALLNPIKKIVLIPPREILHQRIEVRFRQMLAQGFLDEMQGLYQHKNLTIDKPSMRCVGYRQAWQYLDGDLDYDEMVYRAIVATRQLCKRQSTWLKAEKYAKFIQTPNINGLKL